MGDYQISMGFCTRTRRYRISDIVIAVCLPILFVLSFHASFLSRDIQAISSAATGLDGTGTFSENTYALTASENTGNNSFNNDSKIDLRFHEETLGSIGFPLNNTVRANQDLLVFTQIARSGSSSIRDLLARLKRKNNFITVSSPPKYVDVVHIPKKSSQQTNAEILSSVNETAAVIGTFAFVNFSEFRFKPPIQVSMVRDPLERAISLYYFMRAPYRVVETIQQFPETKLPNRFFLRKSLEACLSNDDLECLYKENELMYGHTMEYFCGHESYCPLFGNMEGFQRAKLNVENNFAVVGLIEEWEKSVVVLEHYIPNFFKGASRVYKENLKRGKILFNKNIYKATVDDWARKLLKKRLSLEYEFYDFLRQRLDRQYEAIRVKQDKEIVPKIT